MFSRRFKKLSPYTAGEQPRDRAYVKLNTNENPYPPSPEVKKFLESYDPSELTLYPDPVFTDIRRELGKSYGVESRNIFFGNGSDEILSFCFHAFFENGLLFPEHTYSFYPSYCNFYGISYKKTPLNPDYSIDLDAFLKPKDCGGVILANPNSPTGMYIELEDIDRFLERFREDRVVVVDEAYIDFGGESCYELTKSYKNLLVVHTFSKSRCMAGLRIGFAIGDERLVQALFAVKDSFNSYPVNTLAQKIGIRLLKDTDYYRLIRQKIISTRERFSETLREKGWEVLPSRANFVFARMPGKSGDKVYRAMKDHGILIRHFPHAGIEDFVRITIGTDEQMDAFFRALALYAGAK